MKKCDDGTSCCNGDGSFDCCEKAKRDEHFKLPEPNPTKTIAAAHIQTPAVTQTIYLPTTTFDGGTRVILPPTTVDGGTIVYLPTTTVDGGIVTVTPTPWDTPNPEDPRALVLRDLIDSPNGKLSPAGEEAYQAMQPTEQLDGAGAVDPGAKVHHSWKPYIIGGSIGAATLLLTGVGAATAFALHRRRSRRRQEKMQQQVGPVPQQGGIRRWIYRTPEPRPTPQVVEERRVVPEPVQATV